MGIGQARGHASRGAQAVGDVMLRGEALERFHRAGGLRDEDDAEERVLSSWAEIHVCATGISSPPTGCGEPPQTPAVM
jgi:hypothetical protein